MMMTICGMVILVLLGFILKPLYPMIKLKLQLGNQAKIRYFPILGYVYYVVKSMRLYNDSMELQRRICRQNPDLKVILTNLGSQIYIQFIHPDYFKTFTQNHKNYRMIDIVGYKDLTDHGLVRAPHHRWKDQRVFLNQYFTYEKLQERIPLINQIIRENLYNLYTTPMVLTSTITSEVIMRSFFGPIVKGETMNGKGLGLELSEAINEAGGMTFSTLYTFFKKSLLGKRSWDVFPTKAEKHLKHRIEALSAKIAQLVHQRLAQESTEGNYFLDNYAEEYKKQKGVTVEEIISQVFTFVFVGTDTTANFVVSCLYYLAIYPNIYQELLEEMNAVLGDEEEVTKNHLPKLILTGNFIKEALRLKSPAQGLIPKQVQQTHYVNDLKIEKGWIVNVQPFVPNNLDRHFENAKEFNYRRWEQEQVVMNDNGYAHIPFSAGGRNCLGQHLAIVESKIMLCYLIRNFTVSLQSEVVWKLQSTYGLANDTCIKLSRK